MFDPTIAPTSVTEICDDWELAQELFCLFGNLTIEDSLSMAVTGYLPPWYDGCPNRIFKDGYISVEGQEGDCTANPYDTDLSNYGSDAFYSQINQRGPQGNGFPASVTMVALSNGSWLPQGCQNMPGGTDCTGPGEFAWGTSLGHIFFDTVALPSLTFAREIPTYTPG